MDEGDGEWIDFKRVPISLSSLSVEDDEGEGLESNYMCITGCECVEVLPDIASDSAVDTI